MAVGAHRWVVVGLGTIALASIGFWWGTLDRLPREIRFATAEPGGLYHRLATVLAEIVEFWVKPAMSVGHLVFSIGTTIYILIAIKFEERDLVDFHVEYADYRRRTPMLIPFTKRGESARATESNQA